VEAPDGEVKSGNERNIIIEKKKGGGGGDAHLSAARVRPAVSSCQKTQLDSHGRGGEGNDFSVLYSRFLI